MPKFDPNAYFMQVWNNKDTIMGRSGAEVLQVVIGIVNALAPGGGGAAAAKLIGLVAIDTRCASSNAMAHMMKYGGMSDAQAGAVHIVMMGEDHDDRTDKLRGQSVAAKLGVSPFQPTLVIYEKGLFGKYPTPNVAMDLRVKEEDLIPNISPRIKARSAIVAGYLALCIAADPDNHKIVLFYGEEHRDIFGMLDEIGKHCAGVGALLSRYRYYQLVRSYKTRGSVEDPL